jgi:hypothetical protein
VTIHNSFRLATTCSAVAIALSFPTLLAAQTDAWTMLQAQYIEDLNTLESKFVDLAGAFPAEDYAWRSMDSVRSISEEFMLIVAENYVIPSAWEAAAPTGMTISTALFSSLPADVTSKEDVVRHVEQSFAYYTATVSALSPERLHDTISFFGRERTVNDALFIITTDMHEHLGKLIASARMRNVVPPWTARAQQRQGGN